MSLNPEKAAFHKSTLATKGRCAGCGLHRARGTIAFVRNRPQKGNPTTTIRVILCDLDDCWLRWEQQMEHKRRQRNGGS